MLAAGLNYPGVNALLAIAVFMGSAILMSLLFTRVFVLAGGSVLVMAVLHGSFNSFGDRLMATEHLSGNPLVVSAAGNDVTGVACLAARREGGEDCVKMEELCPSPTRVPGSPRRGRNARSLATFWAARPRPSGRAAHYRIGLLAMLQ
jgi:hypothetical protein